METDIGNPIEYNHNIESDREHEHGRNYEEKDESNEKPREEEYYFHPPQYQTPESFDLFKHVEKSTWIIAFAVFLLGFFMGKTMQPVILRYT
tara:strand:+ start:3896 stop:4171 length:276 start_codon:yes stop_codon:yes gene_type:complete